MTPQHRQHYYHHHRHHHRMDIVLENLSAALLPARASSVAPPSAAATSQLGLPMHPTPPPPPPPPPPPSSSSSSSSPSSAHHFPHCKTLYDVDVPLLAADDHYARNRYELTSYDRDLDGASAPVTVRRIGKSGLLEIAEAETTMCPRPRMFAEDVVARTAVSSRLDRSGLLEAVPEAVDQLEEECNGGASNEPAAAFGNEETDQVAPRGETFKVVDADVSPRRVFDGACRPLEQPSFSEAQADEAGTRGHSVDIQVLAGSPRTQFDVSTKATERLPHLSSFSPGPSLRRPWSEPARGSCLLTSRCSDAADSFAARLRSQRSPEFAAKYTPVVHPNPMNLHGTLTTSSSSSLLGTTMTTGSPIMRGQPQMRRSKESLEHPASLDSMVDAPADPIKASRDSLFAKGSTEDDGLPGEERVEAEGCEHTAAESLKEDDVSSKGSNKLPDNDNVETLSVIILSEQL